MRCTLANQNNHGTTEPLADFESAGQECSPDEINMSMRNNIQTRCKIFAKPLLDGQFWAASELKTDKGSLIRT